MKLLGVELTDYACFGRQFVPLRPGINLLVGRNNAGKTAILRALTTLGALPIDRQPTPAPLELGSYCHGDSAIFKLDLLYSTDESDRIFLHEAGAPESWAPGLLLDGIARWRFSVLTLDKVLGFVDCNLEFPNHKEGVVLSDEPAGLFFRPLPFPDLVVRKPRQLTDSVLTISGQYRQKKPYHLLRGAGGYWDALRIFGPVRLINPHRVVMNRQSLQTASVLPSDGANLGPFLQTLQGNDREAFEQIENFVTRVFPEFRYLNPASQNNQLSIYVTQRGTNTRIPLDNCGTGVEQIITLATFVLTTPKPGVILMDEPHSYLHPTAERALVGLLQEHPEHYYVVSTHSAVLMNSVPAGRITHVSPPGQPFTSERRQVQVSQILLDLGYKNSDSLFYDRLVFVEGTSDRSILRILLEKDGEIEPGELDRTGFPLLEGAPRGSRALQTSILRREKLLAAVAGRDQPRVYVLDGDRKDDEKRFLAGTKNPDTLRELPIRFLPRLEIENYLLVAEAVTSALLEEEALREPADTPVTREDGPPGRPVQVALDNENHEGVSVQLSKDAVAGCLNGLLDGREGRLFPQGRAEGGDPKRECKGSLVLERVYEHFGFAYEKEHSGLLIAKAITAMNQPALGELTDLVRSIFPLIRRTSAKVTAGQSAGESR